MIFVVDGTCGNWITIKTLWRFVNLNARPWWCMAPMLTRCYIVVTRLFWFFVWSTSYHILHTPFRHIFRSSVLFDYLCRVHTGGVFLCSLSSLSVVHVLTNVFTESTVTNAKKKNVHPINLMYYYWNIKIGGRMKGEIIHTLYQRIYIVYIYTM